MVLIWKKTVSNISWCSTFCLQLSGNWQALVNLVMNYPLLNMSGISRLAEMLLASQEGLCPRAMGQSLSQSVILPVSLKNVRKSFLVLQLSISQYFQVTFIENSMFTILTKFHSNFSSDIVRCLAVLWLISLSFKTTYFIISTFPFTTEHLIYIYSILLHPFFTTGHEHITQFCMKFEFLTELR